MDRKKESPQTQAEATGNKDNGKGTKRKRVKRFELVYKWQPENIGRAII